MAIFIRTYLRAQSLFKSPELLRHTRVFTILGNTLTRDLIAKYLALHEEDSDDFLSESDDRNLLAVTQDAIFRLMFRMPGLRKLHIDVIGITPLCYVAISSHVHPLLTTLTLRPRNLPRIASNTPALPNAFRLRDFDYGCDFWIIIGSHPDPLLADILDHCTLHLERLTISSILLPSVVAPPHPITHSLRSLTVRYPLYHDLAVAAFFQVLRVCPQLQHLYLYVDGYSGVKPALLPTSLPNLSTISGPLRLLQLVTGGTNIVEVSIDEKFYIKEQLLTQVILSYPTHLRVLSMRKVIISQTARELLPFMQSLAVFRNLENMTIVYDTSWAGQLSWKDHVSAQDSHSTIKDLLNQLVRLRFLGIHAGRAVGGYNIGCPISKQGDPADRGHPSLESLYVDFICGMWYWDSRTGWEERN